MNLKNQKGITLMTEVITIVIFMLILGTITYSSMASLQVRALNNMYADILTIQERAANYYLKYGVAPVTTASVTVTAPVEQINPNDAENEYYKIDFNKLLNLSLNNEQTEENYYYMNAKTLTVYYSKGVTIDNLNSEENPNETYYTMPSNYSDVAKIEVAKYQ